MNKAATSTKWHSKSRTQLRPFSVRTATVDDAPALVALCAQVQHPVIAEDVARRLERIVQYHAGIVLVAAGENNRVLGLLHVAAIHSLGHPPQAQICGLIVDVDARGEHIATALLAGAEVWARNHELREMTVHSDLIRADAEAFYYGRGFRLGRDNHQQLSNPID